MDDAKIACQGSPEEKKKREARKSKTRNFRGTKAINCETYDPNVI